MSKKFKMAILIVVVLGLCAGLAGCGSADWELFEPQEPVSGNGDVTLMMESSYKHEGVTIMMQLGAYLWADGFFRQSELVFHLMNESDDEIRYVPSILLQKQIGGEWYGWTKKNAPEASAQDMRVLAPSEETVYSVSMSKLFPGEVREPGKYRACLRFDYPARTDGDGQRTYETGYAFCDFVLEEELAAGDCPPCMYWDGACYYVSEKVEKEDVIQKRLGEITMIVDICAMPKKNGQSNTPGIPIGSGVYRMAYGDYMAMQIDGEWWRMERER